MKLLRVVCIRSTVDARVYIKAAVRIEKSRTDQVCVSSYLASGILTRFLDGLWTEEQVPNGGSEGLVRWLDDRPEGSICPIKGCEAMCFSGAFAARRFLGVEGLNIDLVSISGRLAKVDDWDGMLLATAVAILAGWPGENQPADFIGALPWTIEYVKTT